MKNGTISSAMVFVIFCSYQYNDSHGYPLIVSHHLHHYANTHVMENSMLGTSHLHHQILNYSILTQVLCACWGIYRLATHNPQHKTTYQDKKSSHTAANIVNSILILYSIVGILIGISIVSIDPHINSVLAITEIFNSVISMVLNMMIHFV